MPGAETTPTHPRFFVRPLFALLTALTLGILTASLLPLSLPVYALLIAMGLLIVLSRVISSRGRRSENALCLLLAVFVFGMLRTVQATRIDRNDISRLSGGPSLWVCGTVASAVESRPSSFGSGDTYSFTLRVQAVNDYRRQQSASGWLQAAVFAAPFTLEPGDILWVRGQIETPQLATNPDGFDYQEYLKRQGIHATIAARREGDVRKIGHAPLPPLMQTAEIVRGGVEQRVRSHLSPADADLLLGMLLSERSQLPANLVDAFTRTGTVHILSVSGMHIAVITALLLWILRTLTLPKKTAHLLCLVGVWVFALAASGGDGNTPAFRAALCATIFLAAPLLRRNVEPRHSLAFAALVLLVQDPLTLFDPGAQLSFLTVGTLLLWTPLLERLLFPWEPGQPLISRISRGIIAGMSVGIVAHAGSWPLAAFYFHQFSVVAPLANLPISFLADALVSGGLLFSAAPFLPWWLIAQGLSLLRGLALIFAAPPWAAFSIPSPPVPLIFAYYLLVGGLAAIVRNRILIPRRLFTPYASADAEDSGANGGSLTAFVPACDRDSAGRT